MNENLNATLVIVDAVHCKNVNGTTFSFAEFLSAVCVICVAAHTGYGCANRKAFSGGGGVE